MVPTYRPRERGLVDATSNGSVVKLVDAEGELREHTLEPGHECPACHRKVPKQASDEAAGRTRDRISVSVPVGEEGVLDDLMIQLVEKYAEEWPEDAAAAREGVGLVLVGERAWKYRALHFAVYAALTLDIKPSEVGA